MLGVVKYKPSAFFWKLCDPCISVCSLFISLRSKLFSKSSPALMSARVRGERVRSIMHGLQSFGKKANGLYLMTLDIFRLEKENISDLKW